MGLLVQNEHIKLYQYYSRALIQDLGRSVTLHIPGPEIRCFNCFFDPVNKKSSGMFKAQFPIPAGQVHKPFTGGICPVCNGSGRFTTEIIKTIPKGSIRWLKETQKRYLIQGLEVENDCKLKCDIKYLNDFKSARKIVIDGIPLEVTTIIKRGLKELIFISVYLIKSEWNAGKAQDTSMF